MDLKNDLEDERYVLDYLAEGAANIVYHIKPASDKDGLPSVLRGVLLRLRKHTPSSVPYNQLVSDFDTFLAPLFLAENLIQPTPFEIFSPYSFFATLNEALMAREAEGRRPRKRRGIYLATDEKYGLLVKDMTPRNEKENMVDFKPKWLIQSPSAPADAKRCRTCALREMRRAEKGGTEGDEADFCPLDLLRSRDCFRDITLHRLGFRSLEKAAAGAEEDINTMFEQRVQPLLLLLRDLQQEYNCVRLADFEKERVLKIQTTTAAQGRPTRPTFRHGLTEEINIDSIPTTSNPNHFEAELVPELKELGTRIGMTIRDCSLFVRYNVEHSTMEVDVRLADLDMKSMKPKKWADIERQLIDGGWYRATENCPESRYNVCTALQT